MQTGESAGLTGHRLLLTSLAQYKKHNRSLTNAIRSFDSDLDTKLRCEEEESSRAKVHSPLQSTEPPNESNRQMEQEDLGGDQPEIENEELSNQERYELEARVLGIEMPEQFPTFIQEEVYHRLRGDLYNKDKLNDSINFNVYNASIVKGFNTIDVAESIKHFREHFELDLSDTSKNVITCENIEIKPQDMFRLAPMVFLNDTTINFYIKLLSKHFVPQNMENDFHFFNTYFCSKLRTDITNLSLTYNMLLNNENRMLFQDKIEPIYKRLRTWHKKVKLFSTKYVLIPINKKDHWFAVIIVNLPTLKDMVLSYPNKKEYSPEDRPYILLLDPLINVEENLDLMLRIYLEAELKETLGPTYDLSRMVRQEEGGLEAEDSLLITEKNLPHYQLIIPRQKNTFDCGVFALEYMESFVLNPNFILSRLSETKEFLHWFPKSLIEGKRKQIIRFVINHKKEMDIKQNIEELLKQREKLIAEKKDDPDEYDVFNRDEVERNISASMDDDSFEERERQFVRAYYSTLPKEIMALCSYYFEHNFVTK